MLFDLHLCYEGDSVVRPYVVNCDLSKVAFYTERVANLSCVSQIFINIHPSSSVTKFHEFTL